jgi:hypothetical protein
MMDSSVTNAEIGLKEMQQRAMLLKKETDAISANMAEFLAWKHQQQQQQQQQEVQQSQSLPSLQSRQREDVSSAPEIHMPLLVQNESELSVLLTSPVSTTHVPSSLQLHQQQQPQPLFQRSYLKSPPLPARRGLCAMSIDWPKQEAASYNICRDALLAAAANGWNSNRVTKGSAGKDERDVLPLPLLQLNRFIEDAFEDAFKAEILCTTPCPAVVSTKSFPHILCTAASRKFGEGSNLSKALVVRAVLTAWSLSSDSISSREVCNHNQLLVTAAHALTSSHWGCCCMSFFLLLRAMIGPTHTDTRIERTQLLQAVAAVFAGSKWAQNAASAVAQCLSQGDSNGDVSCHEVMTALLKMFVSGWEAYSETMKECFRKAVGVGAAEADNNVWLNEETFCSVISGMCPTIEESLVRGWWRGLRKMGDGLHSGVSLLAAMMLIDRQRLFMLEIGVDPLGNRVAAGAKSLAQATQEFQEQEQSRGAQTGSFSPLKMKTAAVLKQRLL